MLNTSSKKHLHIGALKSPSKNNMISTKPNPIKNGNELVLDRSIQKEYTEVENHTNTENRHSSLTIS